MITLTNTQNRIVNLGTINGIQLVFLPEETKTVDDYTRMLFESQIDRYIEGRMLTVSSVIKNVVSETQQLKKGKKLSAE